MSEVKCFWLEPTGEVRISLRRYSSDEQIKCKDQKYSFHQAMVTVGKDRTRFEERETNGHKYSVIANRESDYKSDWPDDHPKWPTICDECAFKFSEEDKHQIFIEELYARSDNGQEITWRDAPEGAMLDAWWYHDMKMLSNFQDGRSIVVKAPGGYQWNIDGQASNCGDRDNPNHQCWVRHGEPPMITVDKNGPTCPGGGGSIVVPGYHGFLQNGSFTPNL